MQNTIYEFHQENMYCNMCLVNVVGVLSHLNDITEYDVDLNRKLIRVVFSDNAPRKKKLAALINQALTRGMASRGPESKFL